MKWLWAQLCKDYLIYMQSEVNLPMFTITLIQSDGIATAFNPSGKLDSALRCGMFDLNYPSTRVGLNLWGVT